MITARERGRRLEIIVGGGDDALAYMVPPIPAQEGANLLAQWIGLASGQVEGEDALDLAKQVAESSLGPVLDKIQDLRWAEQELVTNAAFFWNVQGGGIDLVTTLLADGLGKARDALLERTGVAQALQTFLASLSSESDSPTSSDDSPATTTPPGTDPAP